MKKGLYFVALYFLISINAVAASTISSTVVLAGGGSVAPATSLNLGLSGLVPSVRYSVVCYIDTTYPFQYVLLSSSLTAPTSTVISYSLNGNYVVQDQLIVGNNLVVVDGSFTNPATDKIIFTNLDQVNPFNVSNCFAIPTQVTTAV